MIPRSRVDSKSALLWTPLPLSWSLCLVGEIQHPRPTQQWFNQLPTGISTIRAHISNFVESDNAGQLNKTDSRGLRLDQHCDRWTVYNHKDQKPPPDQVFEAKKLILNGACGGETERNSAIKCCCVIMPLFSPEGPARCITIHDNGKERRKACGSVQSKAGCQWIHDVAFYNCS
jgi:hypothetical protein